MKYMTSIVKTGNALLALFALLWLGGCSDWDESEHRLGKDDNNIQLTLTVPNIGIPTISTRSMAGTGMASKEDEIKRVDVLIFDATTSPEVYLEHVSQETISQDLSSGTTATFSISPSITNTSVRLVVIANRYIADIVSGFRKGETTKAAAMEALVHSYPTNWPANGATLSGYLPIPMYGEKVVQKLDRQTPIGTISMTRMLARIDLKTTASNFTVDKAYLVNYNTAGYIAPAWGENGQLDDNIYDPMIPSSNVKKVGEANKLTYVVNGSDDYAGEIYTFEAPAAVDGTNDTDASRKDAVCLIVEGKIGSDPTPYFYRIDFLRKETSQYMPLKRNYKYIIDIKQANGIGYASIEDAIASYRTMTSLLDVRIIAHGSQEKLRDVVYNGQYMLGVSEKEIKVRQYSHAEYKVDVFTDTPGGWKATIPEGSWLTFSDGSRIATGVPNKDNSFSLNIPYFKNNVNESRSATITVTASRLTIPVTVTQTVLEPGLIKFMDAYGYELDDGVFFPMEDIHPTTVYVMWTTKRVDAWRQSRNDYSDGGIPIEYKTFTPDIPAINDRDPIQLDHGVQAITIEPEGGNDDWRWDVIYFNLFDGETHLGMENFPINQGRLTFEITNQTRKDGEKDTYELELGPVNTITLHSNANWKIEAIEEIGTGLILNDPSQQFVIGQSNESLGGTNEQKDIVNSSAHLNINFPTGDWEKGKTGTVKVTFRNEMHTAGSDGIPNNGDDRRFPFFRTLTLNLKAVDPLSYTTAGNPYFYVHPRQFTYYDGNGVLQPAYYKTFQEAQQSCEDLGTGWHLPNITELTLSYIYVDALGGNGVNEPDKWHDGHNYWSATGNNNDGTYWSLQFATPSGYIHNLNKPENYQATLRCVRDVTGTDQYPKVQPNYMDIATGKAGTLIISREGTKGVDASTLLAAGATPSGTSKKVPPKLLVMNENTSEDFWNGYSPSGGYYNYTWTTASTYCSTRFGTGWRLPTAQEIALIWTLGGSTSSVAGYDFDWGASFIKYDARTWTMSEDASGDVYIIDPTDLWGYQRIWPKNTKPVEGSGVEPWTRIRCVKSIP